MLVNGNLCDFFGSSRGLKQGDPLSSMWLILVMKALNNIRVAFRGGGGAFKGFQCSDWGWRDNISVSLVVRG